MTCKELIRKLSEYLDSELESALAEDLARHLQHCEDCGIIVDTTRKTIELYCNNEPAPLPVEVKQRLDRMLAEKLNESPTGPR